MHTKFWRENLSESSWRTDKEMRA